MKILNRSIVEKRATNRIEAMRNAKTPKDASVENLNSIDLHDHIMKIILKGK